MQNIIDNNHYEEKRERGRKSDMETNSLFANIQVIWWHATKLMFCPRRWEILLLNVTFILQFFISLRIPFQTTVPEYFMVNFIEWDLIVSLEGWNNFLSPVQHIMCLSFKWRKMGNRNSCLEYIVALFHCNARRLNSWIQSK